MHGWSASETCCRVFRGPPHRLHQAEIRARHVTEGDLLATFLALLFDRVATGDDDFAKLVRLVLGHGQRNQLGAADASLCRLAGLALNVAEGPPATAVLSHD